MDREKHYLHFFPHCTVTTLKRCDYAAISVSSLLMLEGKQKNRERNQNKRIIIMTQSKYTSEVTML